MSARRRREPVETTEYLAFAKRIVRAAGRRVAHGDEPDLAELAGLVELVDEALVVAVAGMRANGQSWPYIASGLGTTPQAARKRFAERVEHRLRQLAGGGIGPQAVAG